jgi:hypothetical protein
MNEADAEKSDLFDVLAYVLARTYPQRTRSASKSSYQQEASIPSSNLS